VAVVGETGSGKTTFAKLLTRLMDPTSGHVLLDGQPLPDVSFASLRQRVVMVPQEGYLFDATLLENIEYGRPGADEAHIDSAVRDLGLDDWLDGLPLGLATPVGQRGQSLSSGERQLVALARAYLADPDLLVLDEATSAVDPATEVRISRALEKLLAGRTAVTIAHRLATAEAADEILVFDDGRLVQRGPHVVLVGQPVASALILTYVLGLLLLISGIVRILLGISHWREAGWIMLLSGAFGVLAGLVILTGFPATGLWVLGFLLGIDLISHGIGWLAYAWRPTTRSA